MKTVVIMRGVPGSGKSSVASLFAGAQIVSADMFRYKDGKYVFTKEGNAGAHNECFYYYCKLVEEGYPLIVVDNTNIKLWEMGKYKDMALENGYIVHILRVEHDSAEDCAYRNNHDVPLEVIERMERHYESSTFS